jgi:hypothetical protein
MVLLDCRTVINPTWNRPKYIQDLIADLCQIDALSVLGSRRQLSHLYWLSGGKNYLKTRLEHSLIVAEVSAFCAAKLGLDAEMQKLAAAVGLCHDIGHIVGGHSGEAALGRIGYHYDHDIGGLLLASRRSFQEVLASHGVDFYQFLATMAGSHADKMVDIHDINSVYQSLSFCDDLAVKPEEWTSCVIPKIPALNFLHTLVQVECDQIGYLSVDVPPSTLSLELKNLLSGLASRFSDSVALEDKVLTIKQLDSWIEAQWLRAIFYIEILSDPLVAFSRERLIRCFSSLDPAILIQGGDQEVWNSVNTPYAMILKSSPLDGVGKLYTIKGGSHGDFDQVVKSLRANLPREFLIAQVRNFDRLRVLGRSKVFSPPSSVLPTSKSISYGYKSSRSNGPNFSLSVNWEGNAITCRTVSEPFAVIGIDLRLNSKARALPKRALDIIGSAKLHLEEFRGI